MMNTTKALSKQFFGAKYQSAGKSLLAAVILFIAIDAAEFQMEIAPFILYLTSTFFTGGVMWQVLTGKRHIEAMQGMFMLPFDNRSFVFSYVMVLGAHTLITKTLPIWALFFAAASWYPWVSNEPERSYCAASSLGSLNTGCHNAGASRCGGSDRWGSEHFGFGSVFGFCGCL